MLSLGGCCSFDAAQIFSVPLSLFPPPPSFTKKLIHSTVAVKRGSNQTVSVQWPSNSSLRLHGKLNLFAECASYVQAQCLARSQETLTSAAY